MLKALARALSLAVLGRLATCEAAVFEAPALTDASPNLKQQIEADWLRQVEVRRRGPQTPATKTEEDAAGACDGIKDGMWGFHTNGEPQPWWQVDLGGLHPLAKVLVFNRCDCADRASHLLLLLSAEGRIWSESYRHNGTVFYGFADNKPLAIELKGAPARFVRVQLADANFLHLDEVEVYGTEDPKRNLALGQPANQSSLSQWSTKKTVRLNGPPLPIEEVLERGKRLAEDLRGSGVEVPPSQRALEEVAATLKSFSADTPIGAWREVYLKARWAVRKLALSNPLLSFDGLLFVKRSTGSFSHMSDQHYGWWSRPGGGVFLLRNFKTDNPGLVCLTPQLPEGSYFQPELSYDGKRVLFAYCKYYRDLASNPNKVDKEKLPEEGFHHIFEMNIDGTALRQLTHGRYDDFDAKYLPNGEIVFLSTRRGQFIQCGKESALATTKATLPDSYVRCGGDSARPVAVYTLHVMDADGGNLRTLSPFENFEWTPSVAHDGRVLYARWDYVDRYNMPFMKLWATNPDGTNPEMVYGNFTWNPHCIFEARCIPGSDRIVATASAHHAFTAGSLVLLDPRRGFEDTKPLTRLTPEVCFPETEGWPGSYYAAPYPLSERYFLVAWSSVPITNNAPNALGLYLYDAFGNLELLYRDPAIGSTSPIPLRPRAKPPARASSVNWEGEQEGRFLLTNVYIGLPGVQRGTVRKLRVVAVPAKTQPPPNSPQIGMTGDDPGKCVLGTVPVEDDGSAYFRSPSGVDVFFQALDQDGLAIQTMRTLTYVQPGQTLSCVGCHEPRNSTPRNGRPRAASRPPSRISVGPEGSWPLRFDRLVQPVLDKLCVSCHRPDSSDKAAARFDLTPARSWENLVSYGSPSLRDHVLTRYREGRSIVGAGAAKTSRLLALLREGNGHHSVRLDADSFERLVMWMDTYAQRQGSFSEEQEQRLREFRAANAGLLTARAN